MWRKWIFVQLYSEVVFPVDYEDPPPPPPLVGIKVVYLITVYLFIFEWCLNHLQDAHWVS